MFFRVEFGRADTYRDRYFLALEVDAVPLDRGTDVPGQGLPPGLLSKNTNEFLAAVPGKVSPCGYRLIPPLPS